ncbi:unnamed protein product [Fraxinus pennsylvanica]|uniref:Uncharacterized protein n=1 Tax=Fraxinus pennsylvanica TaxID=56036 RepID=A0AAD2DZB1_9LAMI|nr:unnamed protein product [Fraxinus pennsylvanica]
MSLENEDQKSPYEASETIPEVEKKLKVSYTREFLLSLCNLDVCKKLPSGFDESWPSEFDDGLQSIHDRPRMSENLSSQGFRRNEYGSSPITRGDSDSYSRGIYGRRGSQLSGQNDQDSDSKSSRDSDSGRHFGHQSRRPWQTPKHDGLLGSGSFPRPSGYAAGISGSKAQGNEHYQLKKSNEPYQPPRPYKAVPYSRRDTDSYNDETFGSTESTSEDRAEEERRRRASFDLMRKEQLKVFQEKQKLNMEKHKADGVSDLGELLEDSREKRRVLGRNNELDSSSAASFLNDSEKSSFASQSPVSRPLVPPGFTNNILDKSVGLKSSIHPPLTEVEKPITGESLFHAGAQSIQNGTHYSLERKLSLEKSLFDGQPEDETKDALVLNKVENMNFHSTSNSSSYIPGMENQLHQNSRHLDAHETLGCPEIFELDAKVLEDKIVGESNRSYTTPNSEKNVSSTLSMNGGGSDTAECHDGKLDVKWSSVESSKFSQWFYEEEAKPTDDIRFGRPNDLLSLIVSGDKGRYQVSDLETEEKLSRDFSYTSSQHSNKLRYEVPSAANGISEQLGISNKKEIFPAVLTCEDLEQSILSEYSAKTSNVQPWIQGWGTTSANTERPRDHVDNYASGHLLSLLQKGTDPSNSTPNSSMALGFAGKLLVSEEHDKGNAVNEPKGEVGTKNIDNLGKTLTMEALFGSAFMKELQSVDAPVSVHRGGPVESTRTDAPEPHGLSFPNMDNDIFSLGVDQTRFERTDHDSSILISNQRKQTKPGKVENWQGYDDSQIDSNRHTEVVSKHGGFDGVVEFQLPEEESLISVDNQNHPISTFIPSVNSGKNDFFFSNAPQKLVATNAIIKDKQIMLGSESLPFTHGPHEQMEQNIPYHNSTQQSLSQFQPPQMTHARPLFHPMDSHRAHTTSQMKFTDPEIILNQESQANHHFLGNMIRPPFHHSSAGVAGFEVPAHHPSMLHQMQMSGNNPPHLLPDFTRGGPMSHPGGQPTGIQEMNPIRGFPFGPGQLNIGTLGMPIPPPDINGNPESFQRLIEIERQARSKQIHPLAAGRNEGIHRRELDMDFRQR